MEVLQPISELPDWLHVNLQFHTGEEPDGQTKPQDNVQAAATGVGRSNVSYENVWKAVRDAQGKWVPVRCTTMRRAVLLASAGIQHRTQAHDVWRRGRVVCVRLKDGIVQAA